MDENCNCPFRLNHIPPGSKQNGKIKKFNFLTVNQEGMSTNDSDDADLIRPLFIVLIQPTDKVTGRGIEFDTRAGCFYYADYIRKSKLVKPARRQRRLMIISPRYHGALKTFQPVLKRYWEGRQLRSLIFTGLVKESSSLLSNPRNRRCRVMKQGKRLILTRL